MLEWFKAISPGAESAALVRNSVEAAMKSGRCHAADCGLARAAISRCFVENEIDFEILGDHLAD